MDAVWRACGARQGPRDGAGIIRGEERHNVAGGRAEISTTTIAGQASVSVSNTGPVIAPDEADRLFQPFQHPGTERIRHTGGHGLGLAIVRAIASAHSAAVSQCPASRRCSGGKHLSPAQFGLDATRIGCLTLTLPSDDSR